MPTRKSKSVNMFKGLRPGDAVELVWKDAITLSRWTSLEECASLGLATILTRGTLVMVDDEMVKVALDTGLMPDGTAGDHHGIGIVAKGDVVEIHKLKRVKRG